MKRIFIAVFVICSLFQVLVREQVHQVDMRLWANHTEYTIMNASEAYDLESAYAVPGGPLMIGIGALAHFGGVEYERASYITLLLLQSALTALIAVLMYRITKDRLVALGVGVFLSAHAFIYLHGTPPTIVATLLGVAIFLYVLEILNRKRFSLQPYLMVGTAVGVLLATRIDVGILYAVGLLLIAASRLYWIQLGWVMLYGVGAFVITDPYMWYMPVTHIIDFYHRFFFNYQELGGNIITLQTFLSWGALSIVSVFLAVAAQFALPKRVLPQSLLIFTVGFSVVLLLVVFTSTYQALRYLIPVFVLWEVLLILYLLAYVNANTGTGARWLTPRLVLYLYVLYPVVQLGFLLTSTDVESSWRESLLRLIS